MACPFLKEGRARYCHAAPVQKLILEGPGAADGGRLKKNGKEIAVRAPLEGTVVGVGGAEEGWYLKIRPRLDPTDPATLRHLLRGPEVHGWLSKELERLQMQLRAHNSAPALADGGVLLPELMNALPEADWDTVLADTFLEA